MPSIAPLAASGLLILSAAIIASEPAHARRGFAQKLPVRHVLDLAATGFPSVLVPRDEVIRTEEEWCEFWNDVHGAEDPAPPCDTELVDFESEVVLTSIGPFSPESCSDTRITRVRRLAWRARSRTLLVDVRDSSPGPACICFHLSQSPVHAVAVPRPVGRVYFGHRRTTQSCEYDLTIVP